MSVTCLAEYGKSRETGEKSVLIMLLRLCQCKNVVALLHIHGCICNRTTYFSSIHSHFLCPTSSHFLLQVHDVVEERVDNLSAGSENTLNEHIPIELFVQIQLAYPLVLLEKCVHKLLEKFDILLSLADLHHSRYCDDPLEQLCRISLADWLEPQSVEGVDNEFLDALLIRNAPHNSSQHFGNL